MAGDFVGCPFYRPGEPDKCRLYGCTTACLDGWAGCISPTRREREHQRRMQENATAELEARTRMANAREYERRRLSWLESRLMEVGR